MKEVFESNYFVLSIGALFYAVFIALLLIFGVVLGVMMVFLLAIACVFFLVLSPFQAVWYLARKLCRGYR